ncbi:LLM class flavin-dependent oxidoreductase [Lysinibacillus sphaericus]|uniref:Monooxygenase n=1 Tax=Lysinibacillus sphaericus TaxID=1421 RepID=A0A2S0JYB3_LYSSH|nr:LLM class flavin-dependent oxidoreductase [Lysinibacillus sphaericus]AVK96133.1 monooxygenase [Lysinibacillus sphaericus]MED4544587.1 LLM class flavin-dependent oxidoreductase [Lysinibacillus sphaericus]TKI20712.1 LLM class flavin-dependent oxidoreductase [Lysinibacillus sphaericus]SUV18107.1 NtaA/SnaA/SoxA/DszA family monooxygenase [Lysinibacillus sphaericus]GEC80746.1 putative monooxygenase YxeK [Lysinibacillus sphaericus]
MAENKHLKLALYLIGAGMHVAAWKHPLAQVDASIDIKALQKVAQLAEKGKFDMAFVADSLAINHESHPHILNRFDPLIQITALAAATSKIGLGATASTTYSEPYVLARQLMSIDHISNGRVAWNLVTTADATGQTALNFSRDQHWEHDHRYERAEEFIDVVQSLWDSWEDDAFIYDRENNIFYDQEKVHETAFKGKYLSVKGPLNIARSIQGQPVIVEAGASKPGQKLAARTAEVVFVHWDDIEKAKAHYRTLKAQLASFGRTEEELLVLQGISPIVGDTEEEAIRQYNELQSLIDPYESLKFVSGYMGNVDFSKYSLDTPAIEVEFPAVNSIQSHFDEHLEIIKKENLKVGELYARLFGPARRDAFVGTAVQIADEMERWLKEGAADGFMLQFPLLPRDLENFVEKVVPILQERGIYREDYTGTTLREHLGLKKPQNRFTKSKVID